MYLSDLLTVPANLAGLPAISIPCGFDKKGLPVGLQLIGNVLEEGRILNAANIFEKDAQIIKNRPIF
jgi:aspartyl-tRNA(Asn)/glutamyl-tRNA(Gln) amidotransferase subunit A